MLDTNNRSIKNIKTPTSENVISNYFKQVSKYKILTKQEEYELGVDIQYLVKIRKLLKEFTLQEVLIDLNLNTEEELDAEIDKALRSYQRMFCCNLRLVIHRAKRYLNRGLAFEDLVQEGNLGLHIACLKFNPNYGTKLSTYAVHWIDHSISLAIKKQANVVYHPPTFNTELSKIAEVTKKLARKLGRTPQDIEIARELNIKTTRLRQIKILTRPVLSLDDKIDDGDSSVKERSYLDVTYESVYQNPEEYVDSILLKEKIVDALNRLTPLEKQVVSLRFGLIGHKTNTISEVSETINKTRESVRQIEYRAIDKLRWQGVLEDF
jgi:RNA polymerase sigma factor (sigma-70 family)